MVFGRPQPMIDGFWQAATDDRWFLAGRNRVTVAPPSGFPLVYALKNFSNSFLALSPFFSLKISFLLQTFFSLKISFLLQNFFPLKISLFSFWCACCCLANA
jgi:hypothetical protein